MFCDAVDRANDCLAEKAYTPTAHVDDGPHGVRISSQLISAVLCVYK